MIREGTEVKENKCTYLDIYTKSWIWFKLVSLKCSVERCGEVVQHQHPNRALSQLVEPKTPLHKTGECLFAKAQTYRQPPLFCGVMGFYRSHISVLIYTLSLAPASPSLRLIAVHSRPIKRQPRHAIQCLLCCQPSQRITGSVLNFLRRPAAAKREGGGNGSGEAAEGFCQVMSLKYDLQISLEGAQH